MPMSGTASRAALMPMEPGATPRERSSVTSVRRRVGPEHTGRPEEEEPDHDAGDDLGLDPLANRTLHRLRVRDEEPVLVRVFVHQSVPVGDPVTRTPDRVTVVPTRC